MKILLALLAVTLTTFLATVPAGSPQEEDLKVIYNLSGILQSLENKELAVTFSDDMLPLGGKRDGTALVKITPASRANSPGAATAPWPSSPIPASVTPPLTRP